MNRLTATLALIGTLAVVPAAATGDSLRDRQDALSAVRTRIEALSKSVEAGQAERDALARDLQATERRIAAINTEIRSLQKQVVRERIVMSGRGSNPMSV